MPSLKPEFAAHPKRFEAEYRFGIRPQPLFDRFERIDGKFCACAAGKRSASIENFGWWC